MEYSKSKLQIYVTQTDIFNDWKYSHVSLIAQGMES